MSWDEPKRLANLKKHGLDFALFDESFSWGRSIDLPASASNTGRLRAKLVGTMNGMVVVAVISPLGREALSLVSLRPASSIERQLYERQT